MSDNKTDELVGLARTPEQAEYLRRAIRAAHPAVAIYVTFNRLDPDYFEISVSSPWSTRLPSDLVDQIAELVDEKNSQYAIESSPVAMTGSPVGMAVEPEEVALTSWPEPPLEDDDFVLGKHEEDDEDTAEKLVS